MVTFISVRFVDVMREQRADRLPIVSDDFNSYCQTQDLIDEAYKDQDSWITKCITSVARMGFFTSGVYGSTSARIYC